MVISTEPVEHEGHEYDALYIRGNTDFQKADWSDFWAAACWSSPEMQSFLKKGDNLKLKVIGDGKAWRISFSL